MASIEEKNLIEACARGELEKFGELYELYADRIYRFIYWRVRHKEMAQDLTSQTFFKALKSIGGFKSERGQFSSWLYLIARNTMIDHFRTKKEEVNVDDFWSLRSVSDPLAESQNQERIREVKELLEKLSAEQREIIVMRVWDGLTHREIAEILGKSEQNSKMIFSRAIAQLRGAGLALAIILVLVNFKNLF